MFLVLALACETSEGDTPAPPDDTGTGPVVTTADADGDGFKSPTDCDDTNPAVFPGAVEECNFIDDDCDGVIDDGLPDADGDATPDCRDVEECDGIDNDGDGEVDEGLDADGDGADGCGTDCDDTDATVFPGAAEVENGIDDDCDLLIDEGAWVAGDLLLTEVLANPAATLDRDGEWIEVWNASGRAVYLNGVHIEVDGRVGILDGAPTVLKPESFGVVGVNGDGAANGRAPVSITWIELELPNDGGALSVLADGVLLDSAPLDVSTPGASRSLDPDMVSMEGNDGGWWCDGSEAWGEGTDLGSPGVANPRCDTVDRDGDGYRPPEDCDDDDASVHPGVDDLPYDGLDADCDGGNDDDVDGDGSSADFRGGDDCDDADPAIGPGQDELCDSVDQDCDGETDESPVDAPTWYIDGDGDGFGTPQSTTASCTAPDGYSALSADCDDADAAVNPGAAEVCGNGIDDDCDPAGSGCGLSGELLAGAADTQIQGATAGDLLGAAVAAIGDWDGDGVDDLVVTATSADRQESNGGAAYVFTSLPSGPVAAEDATAIIEGADYGDLLATGVAFADLDADGAGDLVLGTAAAEDSSSAEGGVFVIAAGGIGGQDTDTAWADRYGDYGSDYCGAALLARDIDGDGTDDLVVGCAGQDDGGSAAGAVYLLPGPLLAGPSSMADATLSLIGESSSDYAGFAVAAGDFDGDGIAEIAVGAYSHTGDATDDGAIYLVAGTETGELDLYRADERVDGVDSYAYAGYSLAAGEDLNGDGFDDLLVGAYNETGDVATAGAVYVLFGPIATEQLDAADAIIHGDESGARCGHAMAFAGDADGDGEQDLLLGIPYADADEASAGAAVLVSGPFSGETNVADAGGRILGESANGYLGYSVASLGDRDGDGFSDILVGGIGAGGTGAAYFFLGGVGP